MKFSERKLSQCQFSIKKLLGIGIGWRTESFACGNWRQTTKATARKFGAVVNKIYWLKFTFCTSQFLCCPAISFPVWFSAEIFSVLFLRKLFRQTFSKNLRQLSSSKVSLLSAEQKEERNAWLINFINSCFVSKTSCKIWQIQLLIMLYIE